MAMTSATAQMVPRVTIALTSLQCYHFDITFSDREEVAMTNQMLLEPPSAAPVGHRGAGVDIHERSAGSISGWWGVLGVVVFAGVAALVAESSVPGLAGAARRRRPRAADLAGRRAAGADQGRAVLRPLRRHRAPRPGSCWSRR